MVNRRESSIGDCCASFLAKKNPKDDEGFLLTKLVHL